MSGILQVPDPSGQKCCDCSVQSGCGCGPPACKMVCRSFASSAALCGFPEFANPSIPPVFYQRATLSGGFSTTCGLGTSCSHPSDCTFAVVFTGESTFDPNTCAETIGGFLASSGSCGCGQNTALWDVTTVAIDNCRSVDLGLTDAYFSNQHQLVQPGIVGTCRTGGTNGCIIPAGGPTCFLDQPDSLDQAIQRSGGTNPLWASIDNGVCSSNTAFTTLWNGTGIFSYRRGQVQVSLPLASAGHTYKITITLYERTTGSGGPFTPYGLLEVSVSCGLNQPAITPWLEVGNVAGLEISAVGCSVVQTS